MSSKKAMAGLVIAFFMICCSSIYSVTCDGIFVSHSFLSEVSRSFGVHSNASQIFSRVSKRILAILPEQIFDTDGKERSVASANAA